jgi:Ca2+:H+ antiporter
MQVISGCVFATWRQPILKLSTATSDTLSSLINISAVSIILPTALYSIFKASELKDFDKQILAFSRGAAIILFNLFDRQQDKRTTDSWEDNNNNISRQESQQGIEQDKAAPRDFLNTFTTLIGSTASIILCLQSLLASIYKTSEATNISTLFIATILIPITSNALECTTVISTFKSSRIDVALGVVVSSTLEIALFVTPVLVILGWIVHQPMTLNFEVFPTVMLFLAILLVNRMLQNGKYTYIHGLVLVGLYVLASDFVITLDSY